jgi:dTDP-4-dehydrorhamnose reductase
VKILVTGGAGYLGSEVCRLAAAAGHDVLATQHTRAPPHGRPVPLDVRDAEAVARAFLRHGPQVVVHTAYRKDDAEGIARAAAAVAEHARRAGARLVHVSTDAVFDGESAPYRETDERRPVGDYGVAKGQAEELVERLHANAAIVRTSILYGGPDCPQTALARRDGVTFYTDEIRCPTHVADLAAAILELAETGHTGPIHLAGPSAVSRAELARLLANGPVRTAPSPRLGRARDLTLDCSLARTFLSTRFRELPAE